MIIVKDEIIKRKIIYKLFDSEKSLENPIKIVNVKISTFYSSVAYRDNIPLIYFQDGSQIIPIFEAENYVEEKLSSKSNSTKKTILYALSTLYSFLAINEYNLTDIDSNMVNELILFLIGKQYTNKKGIKFDLSFERTKKTVKDYCSIYNNYFKGIDLNIPSSIWFIDDIKKRIDSYYEPVEIALDNPSDFDYITPQQFEYIFSNISPEKNASEKIVIYLMYFYGLRLGEALGLTKEDIVFENNKYFLYLRNRSSDLLFQSAYGLKRLKSGSFINSTESEKDIQWKIEIDNGIYNDLINLIEQVENDYYYKTEHYKAIQLVPPEKYNNYVSIDENHYIFFKKYKSSLRRVPLSDQSIKYFLNSLFNKYGIEQKSESIITQFRDGFAMYHIKYSSPPIAPDELKDKMRLAKLSSVIKYYQVQ